MWHGGGSQSGDIEEHCKFWKGRHLPTEPLADAEKLETFETALGLNQVA